MAKNDFVKTTGSEAYPLGHAKENKDASAYTGFKYPSGGGNDIGVYKQPMNVADADFGTEVPTKKAGELNTFNISVGNISKGNYAPTETEGVVTRGNGAATKGTKARGPMA